MEFNEAKKIMWNKLGVWKFMVLASSENEHVMARTVSCLFYNDKIYFKTDKNFRKTQQLFKNPNCALAFGGVSIEGTAKNLGLVVDEPDRKFERLYKEHMDGSYNAYSHVDTEILFEITPNFVEVWDTDERNYAFQMFINFETQEVEVKNYD